MLIKRISEYLTESKVEDLLSNYNLSSTDTNWLRMPDKWSSFANLFLFNVKFFKVGRKKHIITFDNDYEVILHRETSDYKKIITDTIHKLIVDIYLSVYKKIHLFNKSEYNGITIYEYNAEVFDILDTKMSMYYNRYIKYFDINTEYTYYSDYSGNKIISLESNSITFYYKLGHDGKRPIKLFSYSLDTRTIRAIQRDLDKKEKDLEHKKSLFNLI